MPRHPPDALLRLISVFLNCNLSIATPKIKIVLLKKTLLPLKSFDFSNKKIAFKAFLSRYFIYFMMSEMIVKKLFTVFLSLPYLLVKEHLLVEVNGIEPMTSSLQS